MSCKKATKSSSSRPSTEVDRQRQRPLPAHLSPTMHNSVRQTRLATLSQQKQALLHVVTILYPLLILLLLRIRATRWQVRKRAGLFILLAQPRRNIMARQSQPSSARCSARLERSGVTFACEIRARETANQFRGKSSKLRQRALCHIPFFPRRFLLSKARIVTP